MLPPSGIPSSRQKKHRPPFRPVKPPRNEHLKLSAWKAIRNSLPSVPSQNLRARPLLLTSRCYSVLKDRFVTTLLQTLNGQAPRFTANRLLISSPGDFAAYVAFENGGGYMLNGLDIMSTIKGYNPDANFDDIVALINALSVDEINARRAAQ